MSGRVFLGLICFAQAKDTMQCPLVRLESAAPQSWVKHSITELMRSPQYEFIVLIEESVDPDQLVSDEASWSGSTLFSTKGIRVLKIFG